MRGDAYFILMTVDVILLSLDKCFVAFIVFAD